MKIKILKRSFKSRKHIQRKEYGPYFEVSATQASSVTQTKVCQRLSRCENSSVKMSTLTCQSKWTQAPIRWLIFYYVVFWDLTNGYLVAEVFSWYFPQDIQMHCYINGKSLETKQKNWDLLNNFIKRNRLDIPADLVEGTIHCKEGAAAALVEKIYEILTNRPIRKPQPETEPDFTDRAYQNKLPMHARSTATQAVKNNLRITEIQADSSRILNAQKAQKIINEHIEHRREERYENPERFNVKPTIGELSMRKPVPPPQDPTTSDMTETQEQSKMSPVSRETSVQFKEIQVKQVDKSALYNMPIQGY